MPKSAPSAATRTACTVCLKNDLPMQPNSMAATTSASQHSIGMDPQHPGEHRASELSCARSHGREVEPQRRAQQARLAVWLPALVLDPDLQRGRHVRNDAVLAPQLLLPAGARTSGRRTLHADPGSRANSAAVLGARFCLPPAGGALSAACPPVGRGRPPLLLPYGLASATDCAAARARAASMPSTHAGVHAGSRGQGLPPRALTSSLQADLRPAACAAATTARQRSRSCRLRARQAGCAHGTSAAGAPLPAAAQPAAPESSRHGYTFHNPVTYASVHQQCVSAVLYHPS